MPDTGISIGTDGTSSTATGTIDWRYVSGVVAGMSASSRENVYPSDVTELRVQQRTGISPILYFKYVKSKFGILQRQRLDSRMKKLEAAFNAAASNGQELLGS